MVGGRIGMFWSLRAFGLWVALGSGLWACGAGDGRKQTRACPEDCPRAQCELETGLCLPPDTMSEGGQPSDTEPSSGGAPMGMVDDTAPTVTITSPEQAAVLGRQVTIEFEANEPSSFSCTLDDEPVADCESGITLEDLASGEHVFEVIATNEAGNDSEPASVSFVVNLEPSIAELEAIVTPEDTSTGELTFTIDDPDTAAEELVVTAELDSDSPVAPEGVLLGGSGAERTLILNPVANAFGPAILTLTVSDGITTTSRDVPVTVTPVNDAPTIEDVADKRVEEHGVLGPVTFHVGDIETPAEELLVTAKSSNQAKVPDQNIVLAGDAEERTFTITPVAQQSGPVTITLTVSDGELSASDTFEVTLGSTDDEPTISAIADQTTKEDTAKAVTFTVGDPDTALSALTPSASFPESSVIQKITFSGAGASRTATITPKANQSGSTLVTFTISDATGGVSTSFNFTVTPVNDAPVVTAPADKTINEDGTTGALTFTVADVDSPSLTVTATSSNTGLIPNAEVKVSPVTAAPGNRTVTVTPVANGFGGPVTITLTASDGTATGSDTFTVTVTSVNDPPTISNIADRTVEPDTATGNIAFTVADTDGDTPLTVTASSADTRVVPAANITLGGSGGNRTIALKPGANQGGSSLITVTVSDGHGGSASDTFTLFAKVKLTGAVVGPGTVTATGTGCPGGGAVCAALPGAGTVTFVATPAVGSVFVSWTGACSGTGDGVVTPIPTAGVTCTANFRKLWARLFQTPDSPEFNSAMGAHGVVETPKALHYLGNASVDPSTAAIWNANPATGALQANSGFRLHRDGSALPPIDIVADTGNPNGSVVAVNVPSSRGAGLLWFDDANKLGAAYSYEADDRVTERVPYAMIRNRAGGLAILETSHNTSPVAVFPTLAQLTRLDAAGQVVGATVFASALGDCGKPTVQNWILPFAVAQNSSSAYLVASLVRPIDGEAGNFRMNLTLFDKDGTPVWGRHVEAGNRSLMILPYAVIANGADFFVSGLMGDEKASFDGFVMSITAAGAVSWWKSMGDDGVQEASVKGVFQNGELVLTGWTNQEGASDIFAVKWKANGSSVAGSLFGGVGGEQGLYLSAGASGAFNLLGTSADSFGNSAETTWALRVDENLQLNLETGSVIPYQPNTRDQPRDHIDNTCVDGNYAKITPLRHDLNASAEPITLRGAYQATP